MKHVVQTSGGTGSWAAARRVVDEHGPDDVVLLFADTLAEDPDLFRFLDQAAAAYGTAYTLVPDLINAAIGFAFWTVVSTIAAITAGITRIRRKDNPDAE